MSVSLNDGVAPNPGPRRDTELGHGRELPETTLFYRVAQVAILLNVHRTTVYRAIEAGELKAVRFGRGRGGLRIHTASLADFVAASTVTAIVA